MGRTSAWRSLLLIALVAAAGCTEKLTTPGICPALCPSSNIQLADTLLVAADSADTTAVGYTQMNEATFAAASTLDSLKSVVLLRFSPLDTFWAQTSSDTVLAAFPPDSVQCVLQLVSHDTTVHPRLVFYRLPANFDTTMSYAQAMALFADSVVLDTAAVPDSGIMTIRMPTTLVAAPADSHVVAIGIKVIADSATAVGISSGHNGSTSPALTYYVHGQAPQDTLTRNLSVAPTFAAFAEAPVPGALPAGVLAVGGIPSTHALLHLALPKVVVDSVAIVRATLLLRPVSPAVAFPGDSFEVFANPLLRDYGPKSILFPDTTYEGHGWVHYGQTGAVDLDIALILRLWGAAVGDSLPRAIVLSVNGEAAGLTGLKFAGRSGGSGGPQLRVTYVKKSETAAP